jgi:hypothetical protein
VWFIRLLAPQLLWVVRLYLTMKFWRLKMGWNRRQYDKSKKNKGSNRRPQPVPFPIPMPKGQDEQKRKAG